MRDKEAEKIIYRLAERLSVLRKEAGLSLEGLSHLTGLSTSTISEMENKKSFPSTLTCIKICRALKVKPSRVFQDVEG